MYAAAPRDYAIRNEKTSCRSAIKTIQQQNDIGVVRAPKGEQNSSLEKGNPQLFNVCSTLYTKHQLVKLWNSPSKLVTRTCPEGSETLPLHLRMYTECRRRLYNSNKIESVGALKFFPRVKLHDLAVALPVSSDMSGERAAELGHRDAAGPGL